MKHISQENLDLHRVENYSKEFKSNSPCPHIVIDNFLAKDSANKVLGNFKINEHWINKSFVNNYKKYLLVDRKYMDKNCNEIFEELNSRKFINILIKIGEKTKSPAPGLKNKPKVLFSGLAHNSQSFGATK